MEGNTHKVCVRCNTYNQPAYITEALNGFVIQQTGFPFVVVVVDDASTDGEQEVIVSYLDRHFDCSEESGYKRWETEDANWTFAVHNENKNCRFLTVLLKRNLYHKPYKEELVKEWCDAEYIALCEGDDYWTDPLKLQKQVDFLEAHPDFTMCFHGADVKNESGRKIVSKSETVETREYFSNDVFPDWVVPTASIVYRNEPVSNYPIRREEWFAVRDIVTILKCMHTGRVWGMSEHMSVYRMNDGSVMSVAQNNQFRLRMCRHYKALMLNFPKVDKAFCKNYIASVNYTCFRHENQLGSKTQHLFIALKASPAYVLNKLYRAIFYKK
jgi:glycosyltransferase involved in cell wall biosynthesis